MKNRILLLCCCFLATMVTAQNIDLTPALPGPPFLGADVGDVELADIDNDGDLDFIAIGRETGTGTRTTSFRNNGIGVFTEITGDPFVEVEAGTIQLGDLNGNGFLDILITGSTGGGTANTNLYINDGTGNYTLAPSQPFTNCRCHSDFGDIDLDGDLDAIIVGVDNLDNPLSKLYLNDGNANFTEVIGTPFPVLKQSTVQFIDALDNDVLDIILTGEDNSTGAQSTIYYINDGAGNFTEDTSASFTDFTGSDIAVGDSDNDGDLDILISGSTASGDVSHLYLNDGFGIFSLSTGTTLPGAIAGETQFADFDNDGDLDVMIVGVSVGVISNIYENIGNNNFVLSDELVAAYLSCFTTGDIDGDNDIDAIIAGTSFTLPSRATKTYLNTLNNNAALLLDLNCMTLTHSTPENPFVIEGGVSDYTVEILDASETVIQTIIPTSSKVSIDANTLPTGIHFVRVVNTSNSSVLLQHIIKQ